MAIWRTARLFLSSTFRDMHAERDHLIKVVFPRLRDELVRYRVDLVDIDLRWGISQEQSENNQVLSLCLNEIDECRPFFLGFLGHRYGWAPDKLPADAVHAFPWITNHEGAMKLHKEQEALCRRIKNPEGLAGSFGSQALILQGLGNLEGALNLHKKEEAVCRRFNLSDGLVRSLCKQALILQIRGDLEGAIKLHKEEVTICRSLNNPIQLQACLGNQGLLLMAQGDHEGAMKLLKEKETLDRKLNDPSGLVHSLTNQVVLLALHLHQYQEAALLVEEAFELVHRHGLTNLRPQIEAMLKDIRAHVKAE